MKIETGAHHLRLVGKGWQVRAFLRHWSRHPLTLAEWLERRERVLGCTTGKSARSSNR